MKFLLFFSFLCHSYFIYLFVLSIYSPIYSPIDLSIKQPKKQLTLLTKGPGFGPENKFGVSWVSEIPKCIPIICFRIQYCPISSSALYYKFSIRILLKFKKIPS